MMHEFRRRHPYDNFSVWTEARNRIDNVVGGLSTPTWSYLSSTMLLSIGATL